MKVKVKKAPKVKVKKSTELKEIKKIDSEAESGEEGEENHEFDEGFEDIGSGRRVAPTLQSSGTTQQAPQETRLETIAGEGKKSDGKEVAYTTSYANYSDGYNLGKGYDAERENFRGLVDDRTFKGDKLKFRNIEQEKSRGGEQTGREMFLGGDERAAPQGKYNAEIKAREESGFLGERKRKILV